MIPIDLSLPKGAIFSDDRKYRYLLWRVWSQIRSLLLLIGLNPSTGNELADDPTIVRMIVRAWQSGFGGLLMANLHGYVTANPVVLLQLGDAAVGIDNDAYLKQAISLVDRTVCGWGSFRAAVKRADVVLKMIPEPYCLGVNADGQPKHPLYIAYSVPMVRYAIPKSGCLEVK